MKFILPVVLLLIGTGAGVGAGIFLRPPTAENAEDIMPDGGTEENAPGSPKAENASTAEENETSGIEGKQYIKLKNQFVIPIVDETRISSMVVMTLSVEVPEGRGQAVYDIEPKIRDIFLRVLFDFGTVGTFNGAFASNQNLDVVRNGLREAAFREIGSDLISDVLIFEIARQDY